MPPLTHDEAERSIDFAMAIAEYLYVLPDKMAPKA
jgi:hypothetical protein